MYMDIFVYLPVGLGHFGAGLLHDSKYANAYFCISGSMDFVIMRGLHCTKVYMYMDFPVHPARVTRAL